MLSCLFFQGPRRSDGSGLVPVPLLSLHHDDVLGTPKAVPTDRVAFSVAKAPAKEGSSDDPFQIVNPEGRFSEQAHHKQPDL